MAKQPDEGWRQHMINNLLPRMEASTEQATGFTPAPTTTITAQEPFSLGPALRPDFDVLEIVPESAQARLRKLRLRASDSHRLVPRFEDQRELSMEHIEAQNRLTKLQEHPQNFGH